MKQLKTILAIVVMTIAAAAIGYYSYQVVHENELAFEQELVLEENIEALTEGESSWWSRPDYKCIHVVCISLFYDYHSMYAEYIGQGNGVVAHSWNCSGCGLFDRMTIVRD